MSEDLKTIKGLPLFAGISPDALKPFAEAAEKKSFGAGDILFAELTPGGEIYVILQGEVDIQFALANADVSYEIVKLGPGDLLGEVAFVDDGPRSATATAITAVKVLCWQGAKWRELCEKDTATGYRLAMAIARTMAERLRRWNVRILNQVSWGLE